MKRKLNLKEIVLLVIMYIVVPLIIIFLSTFIIKASAAAPPTTTAPNTTQDSEDEPTQTITTALDESLEVTASPVATAPPITTTEEIIREDYLGNAELIDHQQIIFESDIISFISVTTRAGNVFYVLIDHRVSEEWGNVYFLTKVNEYDLLSLLYVPIENDDGDVINPPPVHPSQTEPPRIITSRDISTEGEEEPASQQGEERRVLIPTRSYIIIGVTIVALIIVFVYFKMKKQGIKPGRMDDDDDYE